MKLGWPLVVVRCWLSDADRCRWTLNFFYHRILFSSDLNEQISYCPLSVKKICIITKNTNEKYYISVCSYLSSYLSVSVCLYVCMWIHTHSHTHTHTEAYYKLCSVALQSQSRSMSEFESKIWSFYGCFQYRSGKPCKDSVSKLHWPLF